MTIVKQEWRSQKVPLLIWSLSIGLLIAACVLMYPDMQSQMAEVNDIFSSMGNFTAAFGMDRLNFGTLKGYYAVEGGNILGIGGAFYAAILGVSALMKEERDHTAEFLLTHPVSRTRVISEKLVGVVSSILALNALVILLSILSILLIGETVFWKELLLYHFLTLLMQLEISGICFGVSAYLKRNGLGIGIGIAGLMYVLNIISNITPDAKFLKYLSAFSYTDGADIMNNCTVRVSYLLPGMVLMGMGIFLAYGKYTRKDIA